MKMRKMLKMVHFIIEKRHHTLKEEDIILLNIEYEAE